MVDKVDNRLDYRFIFVGVLGLDEIRNSPVASTFRTHSACAGDTYYHTSRQSVKMPLGNRMKILREVRGLLAVRQTTVG